MKVPFYKYFNPPGGLKYTVIYCNIINRNAPTGWHRIGAAHPKSTDKGQDKHIIHCPAQKRKD